MAAIGRNHSVAPAGLEFRVNFQLRAGRETAAWAQHREGVGVGGVSLRNSEESLPSETVSE